MSETTNAPEGTSPATPRWEVPRVWAPLASEVHLLIDEEPCRRRALRRLDAQGPDDGWWVGEEPLPPGTRSRYEVDGHVAPDPRAPWLPDGVEGPAVTLDHTAFAWSDRGWRAPPLSGAVIYELHVGTFTPEGTYDAARRQLDHLVQLGVTHLELLPLATFDGAHGWGYDGVALYAPHPAYGTPDQLKQLVDDCHRRGLAVLLDVVYNHLGPVGNHLSTFGPYFTDRYETPWGQAVNLDGAHSVGMRRFIVDNATMWMRDYHIDGLRLDAVHALLDTGATHILEELSERVERLAAELGRPLVLIAENDTNDPRLVRPPALGGLGLDAHWCDDVHHAIHTVLTGETDGYYADYLAADGFGVLARALRHGYVYGGRWSPDRQRVVGRPPEGLRGRNLVACIQNHDQVGNRARGERLHQLTSLDAQKVAAALLLTAPFVPLLFQGEEWAASSPFPYFADHSDPALVEAVRVGRRNEFAAFGWRPEDVLDPESVATFRSATLRWDERREGAHAEMLDWYRALIALRRSTPDLLDDRLERTAITDDADARTIVITRGSVTIAANLSDQPQEVDVDGVEVLASKSPGTRPLAPMSVVVLRTA